MRQGHLLRESSPVGWWLLVVATLVIGVAWLALLTFPLSATPGSAYPLAAGEPAARSVEPHGTLRQGL
jgi:hypothetical protein